MQRHYTQGHFKSAISIHRGIKFIEHTINLSTNKDTDYQILISKEEELVIEGSYHKCPLNLRT